MIMNTDEVYEFENRLYVNPTQSRDEQLQFIDNLRATQERANQQIAEDTYALGTQVPTNLGGLTSGAGNADSYWASRYQTPQVASQIANLQATAQADALSKILAQDQSQYQNRANQAYRSYSKRARSRASSGSGSGGSTTALGGTTTTQQAPEITTTETEDKASLGSASTQTKIPFKSLTTQEILDQINKKPAPVKGTTTPIYTFEETRNFFDTI